MTRKERLLATLKGKSVDRPAVNFYEIGGFTIDPKNLDPYNVYSSDSWQPLLELAFEETEIMRFVSPPAVTSENPLTGLTKVETWEEGESKFTRVEIAAPGRDLSTLSRRDKNVDTTWTLEHLLKDTEDAEAYLSLPEEPVDYKVDPSTVLETEVELGDSGLVMIDIGDPICWAAPLFSMEEYTITALTEPDIFHRLLQRFARRLYAFVQAVADALPGRLWRICGPEYASEPYLPPRLFREYVFDYTKPIVDIIKASGGYARIHTHGRLLNIIDIIAEMEPDGLDPIEPPDQGDMQLWEVKERIGKGTVLFGNLEVSDIENMNPGEFEKVVSRAIKEGTQGEGRGFVLMPSASPYGRDITENTLANYSTMVRLAKQG